jgi:hypothetical protein
MLESSRTWRCAKIDHAPRYPIRVSSIEWDHLCSRFRFESPRCFALPTSTSMSSPKSISSPASHWRGRSDHTQRAALTRACDIRVSAKSIVSGARFEGCAFSGHPETMTRIRSQLRHSSAGLYGTLPTMIKRNFLSVEKFYEHADTRVVITQRYAPAGCASHCRLIFATSHADLARRCIKISCHIQSKSRLPDCTILSKDAR